MRAALAPALSSQDSHTLSTPGPTQWVAPLRPPRAHHRAARPTPSLTLHRPTPVAKYTPALHHACLARNSIACRRASLPAWQRPNHPLSYLPPILAERGPSRPRRRSNAARKNALCTRAPLHPNTLHTHHSVLWRPSSPRAGGHPVNPAPPAARSTPPAPLVARHHPPIATAPSKRDSAQHNAARSAPSGARLDKRARAAWRACTVKPPLPPPSRAHTLHTLHSALQDSATPTAGSAPPTLPNADCAAPQTAFGLAAQRTPTLPRAVVR